jgi:hypothetical protein
MPKIFLTDDVVFDAICPADKDQELYWDYAVAAKGQIRNGSIAGLGLRVTAPGHKSFVQLNGKRCRKVLGSTVVLSVASARLAVIQREQELSLGKDPDIDRVDPSIEVLPEVDHLEGFAKRDMALTKARLVTANDQMLELCNFRGILFLTMARPSDLAKAEFEHFELETLVWHQAPPYAHMRTGRIRGIFADAIQSSRIAPVCELTRASQPPPTDDEAIVAAMEKHGKDATVPRSPIVPWKCLAMAKIPNTGSGSICF